MSPIQPITITKESTLLPFLIDQFPSKSRNAVKSILTRGQVQVDGVAVTRHNHPLHVGQVVTIESNQKSKQQQQFQGISLLFEDNDLLVVSKDSGILTVAAKDPTALTAYRQLMAYERSKNPKNRIFVVHRLDRDTSGVLVFAKNEATKNVMQENWNELVTERIYVAIVEGKIRSPKGTISSWLTESKSTKVYASPTDNGGKHAVTHYEVKASNARYSYVQLQLETGRKNQIRVHMEQLGHPVAGDKKYGAKTNLLKRLALHAATLSFQHPKTKKEMRFEAPVPSSFKKLLQ